MSSEGQNTLSSSIEIRSTTEGVGMGFKATSHTFSEELISTGDAPEERGSCAHDCGTAPNRNAAISYC